MFLKIYPPGYNSASGASPTFIHVGDIVEIMPSVSGGSEIRLRGDSVWMKVDEAPGDLLHRMGMKIV